MNEDKHNLITLTAEIVSAHVTHNTVAVSDLSKLIASVHASLAGLGTPVIEAVPTPDQQPAVSIRTSIKPGYLVCLEDGKHFKTLKRHLLSDHQLTPAEYRAKWKLPADYPMTAPDYAKSRSAMALQIGLGNVRQQAAADAAPETSSAAPAPQPEPAAADAAPATLRTRKPRLKVAIPKD